MFTATLTAKSFKDGNFQVAVEYTDGTNTFTQAYNVNSENDLHRIIEERIKSLEELKALEAALALGPWVKPIKTEPEIEPVKKALNDVYAAKAQLEIGIITQQQFDSVVATYKALANK